MDRGCHSSAATADDRSRGVSEDIRHKDDGCYWACNDMRECTVRAMFFFSMEVNFNILTECRMKRFIVEPTPCLIV